MPAQIPEYRKNPTDGEIARVVGAWAKDKQHYLSRYMTIFAHSMHKKWPRLVYIDLFAGPGTCVVEETNDFYLGSPLEAVARPFTDFILVDKDSMAVAALTARVTPLSAGRRLTILEADCNAAVKQIAAKIPKGALALLFLDPTNWQVTFDTVQLLVKERHVDVILTLQGGMLKRVTHLATQPRVDAFFGTDAWRPLISSGRAPHLYDFCETYRSQMSTLGYEDHAAPLDPRMKNSTSALLYHLLFFSRNEKGHTFWDQVVAVGPSGQMNLFSAPAAKAPAKRTKPARKV